jgi:hypothetical protein
VVVLLKFDTKLFAVHINRSQANIHHRLPTVHTNSSMRLASSVSLVAPLWFAVLFFWDDGGGTGTGSINTIASKAGRSNSMVAMAFQFQLHASSVTHRSINWINKNTFFMTQEDSNESSRTSPEEKLSEATLATNYASSPAPTDDSTAVATDYPINISSPILLASSMVIAIASTG